MNVSFLHLLAISLKRVKNEINNFKTEITNYYNLFKEDDGLLILQNILNSMSEDDQSNFKTFLENKYGFNFS